MFFDPTLYYLLSLLVYMLVSILYIINFLFITERLQ